MQHVNVFKISQELHNLQQNIDFRNYVNKHTSAEIHVQQGKHISL